MHTTRLRLQFFGLVVVLIICGVSTLRAAIILVKESIASNPSPELQCALAVLQGPPCGCGSPYGRAPAVLEEAGIAAIPHLLKARGVPGLHPAGELVIDQTIVRIIVGGRLHDLYHRARSELRDLNRQMRYRLQLLIPP